MGSTRVECRKKGSVRQVKASGGKVSQDVGGAWNVETLRNLAVGTLVKARSAEQIGRRARGGDGAFGAPGDGRCVVTEGSHCELAEVVVLGQCGDVTDGGDEFQVGVGDGAARVPIADQGGLYVGRKGFTPHIRGVAVAPGWWEPDAAHAGEGRVATADVVGGQPAPPRQYGLVGRQGPRQAAANQGVGAGPLGVYGPGGAHGNATPIAIGRISHGRRGSPEPYCEAHRGACARPWY